MKGQILTISNSGNTVSSPALTVSDMDNVTIQGSLNAAHIEGYISTEKISKLIPLLCDGDVSKIKSIIEADIDRGLSSNLIETTSLEESYLLHLFTVYLKAIPHSYDRTDSKIFEVIAHKILKRSYVSKCLNILEDSTVKISHPTVYASIKLGLNRIQNQIPNAIDFIKNDES